MRGGHVGGAGGEVMDRVECQICGVAVLGYEPQYCCSGQECACEGLPIEPPLCEACWADMFAVVNGPS